MKTIPLKYLPKILYASAAIEIGRSVQFFSPFYTMSDPTTPAFLILTALMVVLFLALCVSLARVSKTVASGAADLSRHASSLKRLVAALAATYTLSWVFGWLWIRSSLGHWEATLSLLSQVAPRLPLLIALVFLVDFLIRTESMRKKSEGTI